MIIKTIPSFMPYLKILLYSIIRNILKPSVFFLFCIGFTVDPLKFFPFFIQKEIRKSAKGSKHTNLEDK